MKSNDRQLFPSKTVFNVGEQDIDESYAVDWTPISHLKYSLSLFFIDNITHHQGAFILVFINVLNV